MKQAQIRYGSQHQVFFLATLALFPDKLTVRPLDPWFFSPYFNFAYGNNFGEGKNIQDPGLEMVGVMLDDYKNNGYIRYAKANGLFEITEIDTTKALNDLVLYLNQWQQNELLSVSASKPPDVAYQQELLLNAIKIAHRQQNKPRINMADVYGEPKSYKYKPPFWELVLSCQLLDKKIEITDMGYGTRDDGLYENNAQPFVEVEIIDEEFATLVETKSAPPTAAADVVSVQPVRDIKPQRAWLKMPKKHVIAELADSTEYLITTKQKTGLRTDLAPYSLIRFVIDHPGAAITLKYANEKIDGCERISKLGEVIRQCGFDENLKELFFEVSTDKKVQLKKEVYLSTEEIALLEK